MHLETNTRYTEAIKQFLINYLEKKYTRYDLIGLKKSKDI